MPLPEPVFWYRNSVPDLARLYRFDRKLLVRLHWLHPLHKLLRLIPGIEDHAVVKLSKPYLVASPDRLRHRFNSSWQDLSFLNLSLLNPAAARTAAAAGTVEFAGAEFCCCERELQSATPVQLFRLSAEPSGTPSDKPLSFRLYLPPCCRKPMSKGTMLQIGVIPIKKLFPLISHK
jgi:hypothetical protein